MGIQINGNTNNINAGIGSLSIEDIRELDITGVATASNFKTGVSNLHDVGLTLSGGQLDVGNNIKIGNAGVITATSFVGNIGGAPIFSGDLTIPDKIVHTGDTNTAIRFPAADTIAAETAGSERLRIDSSGRVGLGTNNPTSLFHMSGSAPRITLTDTAGTDDFAKIFSTGGALYFQQRDGSSHGNIIFRTENNSGAEERLRVASDGTVQFKGTATSDNNKMQILVDDTVNKILGSSNSTTNKSFAFHSSNRNVDEKLRITSTGQVLLGAGSIATPKVTQSGSLDLDSGGISLCIGGDENSSGRTNSTNKLNRVVTPHYTNAEEPMAMISGYSTSGASELFYGGGSGLTNAATRHSFYTAANTTTTNGTERIRVVSNGKIIVGEANTNPINDFEVRRANNGGDVAIRIGNNTGTNSGSTASLYFTTSPTQSFNTAYIQAVRDGGKLNFGYSTNAPTVTMHVSQNKVGIASAAPSAPLDVFGTNGTIAQFGDPRNASFECIRIKNNVAAYPAVTCDSSSDTLELRSMGSVQATIDSNNNSSGKYFRVMNNGEGGAGAELFKVSDSGIIQCGTSGTLQAFINNSVNGHQFISQCSENNNGFEVYQKHGSNTTRNTFAVYANTGSGGAKRSQLSVRGDGLVTVDGAFDFNKFEPDGTITTTLSSNSASGNYTTIIPLNTSGIGHAQTYLVSIFWNYNSSGSAPYYCAGAVLWGTPHSNSGSGVNYPFEMLSSAHITGNYYLKIRNITGSSSYPGLQAANIGWTAQSGSQYIVKYKRMY